MYIVGYILLEAYLKLKVKNNNRVSVSERRLWSKHVSIMQAITLGLTILADPRQ